LTTFKTQHEAIAWAKKEKKRVTILSSRECGIPPGRIVVNAAVAHV
jgi:hypothetical protein